ncbi:MAG: DNA polymerase III subunit delta' [Sulfurisoma sp.]|nr:DNA polymerase III subunit delta' [Sulfurisoma sp.]
MSVPELLPWLNNDWRDLWGHPGGLPHALLFAGPAGVGKREFAEAMAARLLCERASGNARACGECDACRWFAAGNHPDFRWVIPEADAEEIESEDAPAKTEKADKKKSSQILVGQVRALADFVYVGAHRDRGRVILVQPAEAMNVAAANSLLKILEEPPATVYFILVSDGYRRLLPTIRSRCRMQLMSRPDAKTAGDWLGPKQADAARLLAVTGGMPLRALAAGEQGWGKLVAALEKALADVDQDEMSLASAWEGLLKNAEAFAMEDMITLLQKWLGDLVSRQMAGRARFFVDADAVQRRLLGRSSTPALLHCYNQFQSARPLANHPLNPRLFLEDLAARYLAAFAAPRPSR